MTEFQTSGSANEYFKKYCQKLKSRITLNKHILLIKGLQLNLNSFEPEVAKNRCYYTYPPTGLQYLAAAIEGRGLKVSILDLNYEFLKRFNIYPSFDYRNWISILDDYLSNNNPSIIGISNSFSVDIPSFMEILKYLKEKHGNKIIIAGGQNATYEGEKLLNDELCHFIFKRESENKLNFFLDQIFEDNGTKPTPGILFKYNNNIIETFGEKDIVKLKGNLINAHKLIPIENYHTYGTLSPYSRMSGKDKPFAPILFNRGCEGGCKFCGVVDYMGIGVRCRDVNDFLDEIEYLNKERGIKHFEFLDDDFARYKDKAKEVLQGIINRGLKITWASNNGLIARTIDEELMEKMRDSGCIGFKIGVESGDIEILKKIQKPGNIETFLQFSNMSQKFPEIFTVDNYIVGFPEETFESILKTYKFSIKMNLDWSSFAVYQHNVSYFGNKEERAKNPSNEIGDFIPLKDTIKGKLESKEKVYQGVEVFKIPASVIPSKEQLMEIWDTFNLSRNFINNKNLDSSGNPEKFISWTMAIQERYPTHPYINLFLALAYRYIKNEEQAEKQYKWLIDNLKDEYWQQRFAKFKLMGISRNFPKNKDEVEKAIIRLREEYLV